MNLDAYKFQVWFQNARAKYRRHVLKQEQTKAEGGTVGPDAEFRLSDDEKTDDKTYTDMSNNSSSSLSDMSDIPANGLPDYDQPASGLSELFSNTISTIN